jgi:3-(3-hydroxy-phenyl)propionate hydroxylase
VAHRSDAPVVIAGAGPTGLSLALALGLRGIPVVVLEAGPALAGDLRAGSLHPPTLEMLAALGLGEAMHAVGLKAPRWQVRDRLDGVAAEFDLGLLRGETPFPHRLHLEQHRLVAMLLDRIRAAAPHVEVRFSAPVVGHAQDAGGVSVRLADGGALRAGFLVGCDGARSVVRRGLGVAFEGFTWEERFLVASTPYDLGAHGFTRAGYVADPEHWAIVFQVPGDGPPGLWRIVFPVPAATEEASALDPDAIQDRLRMILGHADPRPPGGALPLAGASLYRVHQRVAARFSVGRVALAGDAAHLNNPLGGLGLNCGVHDAMDLAEALARAVLGGEPHAPLLDLFERRRRPANIRAVQAMSIRNKRLLEERDPATRRRWLAEMRAMASDPVRAKAHLMDTSMIGSVREAAAIR